jgi:hypothetical protein
MANWTLPAAGRKIASEAIGTLVFVMAVSDFWVQQKIGLKAYMPYRA